MPEEHFVKSFCVFKKKSNQHWENVKTLKGYLPSVVQRAMLSFDIKKRSQFNILSIGSGTGEVDMEIVSIIQQALQKEQRWSHIKTFNLAIEPNQYSCQIYQETVAKLRNANLSATFEVRNQSFQEYQKREKETRARAFDIVHFIHSLYYVDLEQTVFHCLENELTEKGQFVCLLGDNESLTNRILMKQYHFNNNGSAMTQLNDGKTQCENCEKVEELIKIAEKYGWKHEIYSQRLSVDVTDVFDAESVDGNLLLDFMTNTENFQKTANEQLLEETLALIEELTSVKDGKRFGEIKESLVFIYK